MKKRQIAVMLVKAKMIPRIPGETSTQDAVWDTEDALHSKNKDTGSRPQWSNGRMSTPPEKWFGIKKLCICIILTV